LATIYKLLQVSLHNIMHIAIVPSSQNRVTMHCNACSLSSVHSPGHNVWIEDRLSQTPV